MNRDIHIGPGSNFIITETPEGIVVPPIPGYIYTGDTTSIITMLNYHIKQSDIAEIVGVRQQHVSSIVQGKWEPRFNETIWRLLILELKRHCLNLPDHPHDLDLYRANVLRPAHTGKGRGPRKDQAATQ